MEFIGNYAWWVNQSYIDFMMETDGTPRPSTLTDKTDIEEVRLASARGYDLSKTHWYIYETNTFPFEIKPPFNMKGQIHWWGIKMKAGGFMPVHRDPHTYETDNVDVERYWMALQDWQHGHIFMYDDIVLTHYKKGDVFKYPDATELHCACNIGNQTRLTFHFSAHRGKQA